jgi:hypothetical protein
MKKIVLILVLVLVAVSIYWYKFRHTLPEGPRQEALKTLKNSAAFNSSLDSMMISYFKVKDAFVNADTTKAKAEMKIFLASLANQNFEELKKDSSAVYESVMAQLNDVKANAESLLVQPNITEMRQDFRMVSESIYPLLKSIHYEGKKLYWQNCPMAFGEGKEANWISNTQEIVNPYLGKNHPEFKGSMLHCGEVKDSIMAQ